ncbi:MAG: ubiquitin-like small modifier protein 1 [Dehalococcoidia bacterium]
MAITVRIPTPLRKLTSEQDIVEAAGDTLAEMIDSLEATYPGLKERLCDETGDLRRFVNIYVTGEDVRFAEGVATRLNGGDEVSIVPAVAGGA